MQWINILHFYQPPTQEPEILHQIAQQSYLFLANLLEKNPEFKITLNICGCLTEMLSKNSHSELLNIFKKLADNKQIEFTGSAAYHALLPLLPEEEIIYQIYENKKINKKYFGDSYEPKGFFLPELAYSEKVAKIIKKLGYEWIILDEISHSDEKSSNSSDVKSNSNLDKIYQIKKIGLDVIFRNRKISQTYVPETVYNLANSDKPPNIIITANDSELYGHHHKDDNNFLNKIIESKKVDFLTASEFINLNKERVEINPINSSWESSQQDLKLNCPFHLWQHKGNKIHQHLWKLANLAIKELYKNQSDKEFYWARYHLNRGIASCTFWWASEHDLREQFGPVAWNPDFVEKGANELIRSIRSISSLNKRKKIKAEKIYLKIKKLVWIRHWKKYA
jgi:predicted glycosyl hydrolase (DUF1957 family)